MVESRADQQIGYLLRSYPRLSQTFILNEILALEELGVSIQLFAVTDPREKTVQAGTQRVKAAVQYLADDERPRPAGEVLRENVRVAARHLRGYLGALAYLAARREIDRGYTASSRWTCFLQAVHLVHLLDRQARGTGKRIHHLHAHFAHDPALIAHLVQRMTGLSYSFTAHARDLYQVPPRALVERIAGASAVITCCRANLEYLEQIAPAQRSKISLVYHGVNLRDFPPLSNRGAASESHSPLILSVGRLVEKKGFYDLLEALLLVKKSGTPFRCVIYGDGPLCQPLKEWIEAHGMSGEVSLPGDSTQQELISVYQSATLFALTPLQTQDGDRDGIPNVLVEAMAVGLPVVTTAVAGIPELVQDNRNGLLYPPRDVEGISSGIIELLHSPERRRQLGQAASKTVAEQFDIAQAARRLEALFA